VIVVHVKVVPQISRPGLGDQPLATASGGGRAEGLFSRETEHETGRRENLSLACLYSREHKEEIRFGANLSTNMRNKQKK
jgi:hypothetical protein